MKQWNKQRGAALVISLLMLVALTLLAVSALRSTVLQEKMVSNLTDAEISRQVAEGTIKMASRQLPPPNGAGWYIPTVPAPVQGNVEVWKNSAFWVNAAQVIIAINGQNYTGEYIVENLGYWTSRQDPSCKPKENPLCERQTYRITARNQPVSGRAAVMMQVIWRM